MRTKHILKYINMTVELMVNGLLAIIIVALVVVRRSTIRGSWFNRIGGKYYICRNIVHQGITKAHI